MRVLLFLLAALLLSQPLLAEPRLPEDYWQELLLQTRDAAIERQLEEEARLQLSQEARSTQAQALAEAENQREAAKTQREQLEEEQQQLEQDLQELQERLQRRSASLGEVFTVYEEEKSNFHGWLTDALMVSQQPGWQAQFRSTGTQSLPEIQDLENLWKGLQQAWLASGQVQRVQQDWIDSQGQRQHSTVIRLGDLQLLNEQGLLRFEGEDSPVLWPRQPRQASSQAAAFTTQASQQVTFDPARGLTLRLFSHQPSMLERIQQGGYVGYLILFLGSLGLCIAAVQSFRLLAESRRVKRQLESLEEPLATNSLGRVLTGLRRETVTASTHPEALEARMDELLLREAAGLERGLSWVKLLAAIAPLLGLLGTVTGMIATFQAITLFGTGDPSMMASGISQALMTTVLGLVTAVPLLLAHLLLQGRSRHLARTLEAETSAWLAQRLATQVADRSS